MSYNLLKNVTLLFWHEGKFMKANTGEMIYLGGKGKTFEACLDNLCYWGGGVHEMATKIGNYDDIDGVWYLRPGEEMMVGLTKIEGDVHVFEARELAIKNRPIDLYVQYKGNKYKI